MKIIINFVLIILLFLATINFALASQGVVGMVILDSSNHEVKNVVLEDDSNTQLSQAELKEQYVQQKLEQDKNVVDEKITGASVIDLENNNSKTTLIFVIILIVILLLLALFLWLIFK